MYVMLFTGLTGKILNSISEAGFKISALEMVTVDTLKSHVSSPCVFISSPFIPK